MSIKSKPQKGAVKMAALSHNRKKNYILQEGVYVPFLKDLGVITEEGKIVRNRFDKFRQINRFLEFIEDIFTGAGTGKKTGNLRFWTLAVVNLT